MSACLFMITNPQKLTLGEIHHLIKECSEYLEQYELGQVEHDKFHGDKYAGYRTNLDSLYREFYERYKDKV